MKSTPCSKLALCAAGLLSVAALPTQAVTTIHFSVDMSAQVLDGTFAPGIDQVSARGTFNNWDFLYLTNNPSSANPNLYTGTAVDTTTANPGVIGYKYYNSSALGINNGWDDGCLNGTSANRPFRLPATSGQTVTLPSVFFGDQGPQQTSPITFRVNMAQKINIGAFNPSTGSVVVRGTLNGWAGNAYVLTNDPSIHTTNSLGVVTSNVWAGTYSITGGTNSAAQFKYVFTGSGGDTWEDETTMYATNLVDGANRFLQLNDGVLPIVDFSDIPYQPIGTNTITFQVDMTAEELAGNFDPLYDSVSLRGDFNNWSVGLNMTNNPSGPNPKVYSTSIVAINSLNGPLNYKFTYTTALGENYEGPQVKWSTPDGGPPYHNRVHFIQNGVSVLPPIYFDDIKPSDLLPNAVLVSFAVDMNGAIGTDGHVFNPGAGDIVFINGDFAGWYPWYGGVNPADAPPEYQLHLQGAGVYTNSFLMPANRSISLNYRYGMGYEDGSGVHGAVDDDTAGSVNRIRVVRTTKTGSYAMPVDTFGTLHQEPLFTPLARADGQLVVGAPSGGYIPVQWLGRPGAHLQSGATAGGPWTDYPGTDGTNWTTGMSSVNGFISTTNYPVSGNRVFRLIYP